MRLACLVDNLDVDNLVSGAQLGNDVFALDSAAKHRVAGIKVVLRTKAEVELGTGGIGVHGTGHGKRAVLMAVIWVGEVLGLDAIARAAGAGHAVGALEAASDLVARHVAGIGAAALDDKAGNIAMELQPIIETHGRKLAEISDVDGCALTVQAHANGTLGRLDDGDLVTSKRILGSVKFLTKHEQPFRRQEIVILAILAKGRLVHEFGMRAGLFRRSAVFLNGFPLNHVGVVGITRLGILLRAVPQRRQDIRLMGRGLLPFRYGQGDIP